MTTNIHDAVLPDPLELIARLVADADPGLDVEQITDVVAGLGAGRAKRRRLAQAIHDNPDLLTAGGPPVPWAVGQLLLPAARRGSAADRRAPLRRLRPNRRLPD